MWRQSKVATIALIVTGSSAGSHPAWSGDNQSATEPSRSPHAVHYRPNRYPRRAALQYDLVWGIDSLTVRYAESGEMIRFSYRVLDPEKAKVLNDKRHEPSLIDPGAGVKLVIPELEKVGKLRQSNSPQTGRSYWMAFSNKGRLVRPGHRVSVVIGPFRAEGLVVE